jgi:Bifunctional DNA primase/polymerase, N-terminal
MVAGASISGIENDKSVVDAAREYIERGWSVVPVPAGEKGSKLDGWQNLRITEDQVGEFFTENSNIGVLTGEPSNGLANADVDCEEAEHAAKSLMPKTLTSGRGDKIRHHWFDSPGAKSHKFKDVDEEVITEIRADGCQTLVAPSVHPSGDLYEWKNAEEPRQIDRHDLRSAVARVAGASLITRHLPDGGRHDWR